MKIFRVFISAVIINFSISNNGIAFVDAGPLQQCHRTGAMLSVNPLLGRITVSSVNGICARLFTVLDDFNRTGMASARSLVFSHKKMLLDIGKIAMKIPGLGFFRQYRPDRNGAISGPAGNGLFISSPATGCFFDEQLILLYNRVLMLNAVRTASVLPPGREVTGAVVYPGSAGVGAGPARLGSFSRSRHSSPASSSLSRQSTDSSEEPGPGDIPESAAVKTAFAVAHLFSSSLQSAENGAARIYNGASLPYNSQILWGNLWKS